MNKYGYKYETQNAIPMRVPSPTSFKSQRIWTWQVYILTVRLHCFSRAQSVVARVHCGGKSALRRVQTSNDTCVSVESKLRWVPDRPLTLSHSGVQTDIQKQTKTRTHAPPPTHTHRHRHTHLRRGSPSLTEKDWKHKLKPLRNDCRLTRCMNEVPLAQLQSSGGQLILKSCFS